MGNPQTIKFRSVDELIDFLPEEERRLVITLRSLIQQTLPHCTEKLSYNVPFYAQKGNICFIWPAAVPWGNLKEGVALGFTAGRLLDPDEDHLEFAGRKSVGRIIFKRMQDIDPKLIETYLMAAEDLNKNS